jgi:hypothetical protein
MKTIERFSKIGFVLTLLTVAVPLIILTMMTERVGASGQPNWQDDHGKSVAPELEGSWRISWRPTVEAVGT